MSCMCFECVSERDLDNPKIPPGTAHNSTQRETSGVTMSVKIEAGTEFMVKYPFVRGTFFDQADGGKLKPCWVPGIRESTLPPEESEPLADAEGIMIITVVGTYRPGKFPERVFYTRKWQDPNGKVFGKNKLIIKTKQAFNRRISKYLYDYRVEDQGEITPD